MNLIVDTNAYSAFFGGNLRVIELMETADALILPAVVLGELFSGFLQGTQQERNFKEFKAFSTQPGVRIHELGLPEAEKYGLLIKNLKKAGISIPTNDVWIAATALSLGASVLTKDSHFQKIHGLFVIDF